MADLPRRIELVPWGQPKVVSGFNATRNQSSAELGGGWLAQQSAAAADDGDYYEFEVLLDAGTWALDVIYQKNPNSPIHDFILGGVSVGTIDTYAAGTSHNNVTTISGVTVATPGHYTLRVAANGKNAASGDYNLAIQFITLRRTGA